MIFTYHDYIDAIKQELSFRPFKVWIATYGFNVGIADNGNVFTRSPSYQLVQQIARSTSASRILIGTAPVIDQKLRRRLTNSAEYFPRIEWRTRSDQHLKCWIFFHQNRQLTAIVGGRNLGDSQWADVSILVGNKDAKQLSSFYDQLWLKAEKVKVTKGMVVR